MSNIIMIGNPGSGKSTLLSSLVERAEFPSGPSIGKGKTTAIQQFKYNDNTYIDTPGLSDVKLRKQAAAAIESAFKIGGKFKVFFMVILESGRVKPDDVATIKLVLDAIQIRPNQYSILVNKISRPVMEYLAASEGDREELATTLVPPSFGPGTQSIFNVPMNIDLLDQSDKWAPLSQSLLLFISNAPEVHISPESVRPIQYSQFETILVGLRDVIQQLQEDNAAMRRAMAEHNEQLKTTDFNLPKLLGPSHKPVGSIRLKSKNTIVMIGNPEAGKSTLLTSLMNGTAQFHSGVFIGKGYTSQLQEVEYNGTTYVDTPGLSDVMLRQKAAEEIVRTLQKGGNFKISFVVTLESGRVKPDDVTTIKLVLEAAHLKDNQFSIIINKMSADVVEMFLVSEEDREELAIRLTPPSLGISTRPICFVPENPAWMDKSNIWGKLSPELLAFIDNAPLVAINPDQVAIIQTEDFNNLVEALREEIRQLREDNTALRKAVKHAQKKHGKVSK